MKEHRRSMLGPLLATAYRWRRIQSICVRAILRLEGGHYYSATLREILEKYHGVKAGAYSYGEGLVPGSFPSGVTIGRYVSIAPGVRVFLRNHPMDLLSMHPFFFNHKLGWIAEDAISTGSLDIGHDAWIGAGAIITAGCSRIGIGAVIGAGAVVTKDVADFEVVAGVPARTLKFRFRKEVCDAVLASRWWELSVDQLAEFMPSMIKPLKDDLLQALTGVPTISAKCKPKPGDPSVSTIKPHAAIYDDSFQEIRE